MRIAMIGAKGLPGLRPVGGGIEAHVENLALNLTARGHKVTVYVRPYANPDRLTEWQGIRVVTIPSWHRKNLDTISHVFWSTFHALRENYQVIHYHGVGPSTLCWIPRLFKRKARVIVTFHSRDQFHEKWSLLARMFLALGEWTAVRLPHATIAVSHAIRQFCELAFPGSHVYYVPNGVHTSSRVPGIQELERLGLQSGHYFLQAGRLMSLKAQDQTIQAFRTLQTDDKLVIAGAAALDQGKYAAELKKLAKDDPRIVFTGQLKNIPLEQLTGHARAIVHPSRFEGLAITILEAMSHGRPAIMSDIPANLELIDHSGLAVPVNDVPALAAAMQWVLDNPVLADERGARAKDVVKRLYSWESVTERVEKIYKNQKAK
jgi:glycosyltransferase involved in cell wall biosynthesis